MSTVMEGSAAVDDSAMQAPEVYAPTRADVPPAVAFARWTKRLSVQTELVSARELAGLADAELAALESEFVRCPTRPRTAWARHGRWVGALLVALAVAGFVLGDMAGIDADATRALMLAGAGLLLVGLACVGTSWMSAFGAVHLDVHYGTAGLWVGRLDEQHPWLYKTAALLRHEAAEGYRRAILAGRGVLRGVDYVMMREIVTQHDSLERMRPARAVAEQVQSLPVGGEPPAPEPRLVLAASSNPRT